MKVNAKTATGALTAAAGLMAATGAHAAQPMPWQLGLQPAATDIMAGIRWFEQYTLWFIVPITIFVALLLAYVLIKFRKSANPVASRTSHNTTIEVVWTVAPVLILLAIAFPSFQLLNAEYSPPREAELTVKATGFQWYWGYEYQGAEGEDLSFEAVMLQEADRAALGKEDVAEYPRLLAVDNEVVVPVDTVVRLLITAGDVLHSFAMPAFGVKMDAVPGRINETWFEATEEGLYYGQCSELCGKDHAYMPIAIRVVSKADYDAWKSQAMADLSGANKALMASIAEKAKTRLALAD